MKILIDGRLLSIKKTGISRYTEQVIDSYITKYGVGEVCIIVNEKHWSNKYKTIHTRLKPFNLLHFIFFPFFINKQNFEVLHSTFYSGVYRKQNNKTIILTVHDIMYRIVPCFFSKSRIVNSIAIFYYDLIVRLSLRVANVVISVSRTTQNDLYQKFQCKSIVVPEGVNQMNRSDLDVAKELDKLGLEKNKYFLYVGNTRPHKNIDFLIKSHRLSNTKLPLVICGNCSKTHKEWMDCSSVIFIGYVEDNLLSLLYENCVSFIFPSLYEGFGLPILEALAHNTHVISSDGGALKELKCESIDHFSPTNHLQLVSLIKKAEKSQELKYDNSIFLFDYSWENCLNLMHELLFDELKKL